MQHTYQQIEARLAELLRFPATKDAPAPVRSRWEIDVEVYQRLLLRLELDGAKPSKKERDPIHKQGPSSLT